MTDGRKLSREERRDLEVFLASNRGRPQARPPRTAGFAATRAMKPLVKRYGKGTSLKAVRGNWTSLAGKYAPLSRPDRVVGGKDGRTLVVEAKGPAASLLAADSARVLARLNDFAGASAFSALRVVQCKMTAEPKSEGVQPLELSPEAEAELLSSLETVQDPALRGALEALGRKAKGRKENDRR